MKKVSKKALKKSKIAEKIEATENALKLWLSVEQVSKITWLTEEQIRGLTFL